MWVYVKSWHITGILALQPEPLRALLLQVLGSRHSDLREEPAPIVSSSVGLLGVLNRFPLYLTLGQAGTPHKSTLFQATAPALLLSQL